MKRVFTIKYFFFLFFFFTTNEVFSQWSTDPNNNLIIGYGLNPELCSDSAGGCYITYEVGYPAELYLHRIDKYGYQPWGDKRIIAGELDEQSDAKIIEDGEGGVIVSYGDHILHERYRLRIQRVDSNGNFLWGSTGVKPSITPAGSGTQKLVTDGDGGCVIVWTDTLDEYRINRIDRYGQRVWGDSGLYIQSDYNLSPPRLIRASDGNYYVQIRENLYRISKNGEIVLQDSTTLTIIVPDSEGGIVQSGRVWTGLISKLVAQRKDSLGNNLWQEPYVEIADSLDIGTSLNILSNNGYYHYEWLGRKNGIAEILQIQSLRNDGTKLFVGGSISLSDSPTSVTSIPIISSYGGSNIYAWTHWDSPQTYNANFARRIDSTGLNIWPQSPVLLSEPYLGYFSMTTDCYGGAIGVGYFNSDFAIRVLKVSLNGNLGEVITSLESDIAELSLNKYTLFQNYPNPFNSTTVIKYELPEDALVTLKVYDILGNEVVSLVNEAKQAGYHSIKFNAYDLSSGIYFYRLNTGDFSSTKKLLLLK